MNKDRINVEGVQIGVPAASDVIVSLNSLFIETTNNFGLTLSPLSIVTW